MVVLRVALESGIVIVTVIPVVGRFTGEDVVACSSQRTIVSCVFYRFFHSLSTLHPRAPSLTMSAEEVAKAFVQHFYQAFDAGADSLGGLYVSHILMDFGRVFLR